MTISRQTKQNGDQSIPLTYYYMKAFIIIQLDFIINAHNRAYYCVPSRCTSTSQSENFSKLQLRIRPKKSRTLHELPKKPCTRA